MFLWSLVTPPMSFRRSTLGYGNIAERPVLVQQPKLSVQRDMREDDDTPLPLSTPGLYFADVVVRVLSEEAKTPDGGCVDRHDYGLVVAGVQRLPRFMLKLPTTEHLTKQSFSI